MPAISLKQRSDAAILWAGAMMGCAQVIIMRRALALTGGDEVVFALTLSVWLLMVAVGGAFGSWLAKVMQGRGEACLARTFALILLLLSLIAFAAPVVFTLVSAKSGWIPGIAAGGGALFIALIVAILPVGLSGGALFPLGCALQSQWTRNPVSIAYLLEAAGSFFAGTIVTLLFSPHLPTLSLPIFFSAFGLGLSLLILQPRARSWPILTLALVMSMACQPALRRLDFRCASLFRPGQKLLDVLQTPYGLIEVTDRQGQISVYENGLLLTVSDDPAGAEERADLSLAQHLNPQRILWIGGALGAALGEALRQPSIRRLDLIELNQALFNLAGWFDPVTVGARSASPLLLNDPRVRTHLDDGRRFLAKTEPQTYDLICLNLPGPRSARLAKFYTIEGFDLAKRALKSGGVLIFSIESSEDYIGPDLAMLLKTVHATLKAVFPQVEVLPGANAIFMAADSGAHLAINADSISARLAARGITLTYWDRYRLEDRLAPSRVKMLEEALNQPPPGRLNRDRAPISFYLQQIFWSRQVRGGMPEFLKTAARIFPIAAMIIIAAGFVLALSLRLFRAKRGRRLAVGWAVAAVGLSGISLEILALIVYQVHFGSGYREVGLLVGLYMAGLAVGTYLTTRIAMNRQRLFGTIQVIWVLVPLILMALASNLVGYSPAFGQIMFFGYMLLVGVLGGAHFPLAVGYFGSDSSMRAGRLYALDLLAAAAGALTFGLFALPVLGSATSALDLSLLNLPPLLLLMRKTTLTEASES